MSVASHQPAVSQAAAGRPVIGCRDAHGAWYFRLGMALLPDRSTTLPLLRVANPNGERKPFVSRVPPVYTAVYLRFVRMPQCGRLRRAMLLALIQCLAARSTV